MRDFLKSKNVGVHDYTGDYAKQPYVNYTSAPSSQQQLEDRAVNAGYQGDYDDTAAMQGYVKPVNTGIVTPDVTKFATTDNLNTNIGVGVNTLLGGNTQPQPAVTQQQQTVVETDAERIARQQASIAALEASYPQQFSLTATQPQQQPTYSGIAAPTAVTTNNQLTLAQPQQQYTLGPQVPQQTSLQAFGDRAREINTIQNNFTSAADASAYEAAHPGYTNNVYTP